MTAEQEQVEALARVLWSAHHRAAYAAVDAGEAPEESWDLVSPYDRSGWRETARDVIASDWLAEHDAQVRAEATAAVVAQVEETLRECAADQSMQLAPGWMVRDAIIAKVRAALTPDAGAALRAREAKALRDAADALAVDSSLTTGVRPAGDYNDARDDERIDNVQWLRDRADALEAGGAR